MGSSFEYTNTRLASRLRRSARWKCLETGDMTKPLEPSNQQSFVQWSEIRKSKSMYIGRKQQNPCVIQKRHSQGAQMRVTEYGKCLETGKRQSSLWSKNVTDSRGAPTNLLDVWIEYGKWLETGK